MIKLVAIDLDGTLLDPNRQITAEVKSAVKKAKAAGVKIVITTGRPLPGVVDILKALELTDQSDYVILTMVDWSNVQQVKNLSKKH